MGMLQEYDDGPLNFIEIESVLDSIYLLKFSTQALMAQTMMRFQEYYESPKFCGQVFSHDEFKEWYTKKTGAWTYLEDWDGFNIPSKALAPFRDRKFYPITNDERFVLACTQYMEEPFYLIATLDDPKPSTLRHEIAHGLYATNADYRSEVLMHLDSLKLGPINRFLFKSYHPSVWLDECHAYLTANYDYLIEKGILTDNRFYETHLALSSVFEYYTQGRFKL